VGDFAEGLWIDLKFVGSDRTTFRGLGADKLQELTLYASTISEQTISFAELEIAALQSIDECCKEAKKQCKGLKYCTKACPSCLPFQES
jgi:predicted aldo/keto reductase-like oxidoreductase